MKLWCLLLAWFAFTGGVMAGDAEGRFSQTLTALERKEVGLEQLTSDQVAVLDALVRRDLTLRLEGRKDSAPNFSQRLTDDERRNTGLDKMAATERARIDAIIERYETGIVARALLAPPVISSPARLVRPTEAAKTTVAAGREFHGELSLTLGWGKGGYSERTGSMMVRMDDPAHNLSVAVGYSETRVKGPAIYRDPYGYEIPRYSDGFAPLR